MCSGLFSTQLNAFEVETFENYDQRYMDIVFILYICLRAYNIFTFKYIVINRCGIDAYVTL